MGVRSTILRPVHFVSFLFFSPKNHSKGVNFLPQVATKYGNKRPQLLVPGRYFAGPQKPLTFAILTAQNRILRGIQPQHFAGPKLALQIGPK